MKKILIATLFSSVFFSFSNVEAAYSSNSKSSDDDYIYFSDDLLRSTIGNSIFDSLYYYDSPLANVFQVKQLKQYSEEEFNFEGGRSIEGMQNLPDTVTSINGSESGVKDITPLFEMEQLKNIRLSSGFIDDNDQLQRLLNMENLQNLTVSDVNEAFKSFNVEIPETLTTLNYESYMVFPALMVQKNQKFQMANPIRLTDSDFNTGTLTFEGGNGFSFENNILTWNNSNDIPNYLHWEYKDTSNNRNIKIYGTIAFYDKLVIE